jgi:hypothetical protein
MSNNYAGKPTGPNDPASVSFPIVPHASNPLGYTTKRIYVGTGGDVVLRSAAGSADVTYKNCGDGTYLHVQATHIRAAGTTATDIVGEA